jgi:hypothetical protein
MRFSFVTIICALAAYATAVTFPGADASANGQTRMQGCKDILTGDLIDEILIDMTGRIQGVWM